MANSKLTKKDAVSEKQELRSKPKGGMTLPPYTIEKSSVRELPRMPEQPVESEAPERAPRGAVYASESVSDSGPYGVNVPFIPPAEDAAAHERYASAAEALEQLEAQRPVYDSRYDAQIRSLYEQITGRAPFRYDSATDPLFRQYRQSYIDQGALAMRDTMGQAAALTGGYGSSYAQTVGQQQYDAYLRRLADILPETYGMALNAYNAEGQRLDGQLAAARALEQSDYERYLDELGQYNRDRSFAQSEAQEAYERMIYGDEQAYARAVDDYRRRLEEDKLRYARLKDYTG